MSKISFEYNKKWKVGLIGNYAQAKEIEEHLRTYYIDWIEAL